LSRTSSRERPPGFPSFDHAGNLFIVEEEASNIVVGEITGGCKATKITQFTSAKLPLSAGGIQVDQAGQIAIADHIRRTIDIYSPPKGGSLGNPVSIIRLKGSSNPETFAFLASGADLYTVAGILHAVADEYAYPAGGAQENAISVGGNPVGVAVTPPLVP
jgi:hypothetical protein